MSAEAKALKLQEHFPSSITKIEKDNAGEPIVWVKKEDLLTVLKFLKDTQEYDFQFLADLTAYDEMGAYDEDKQGRFVMVYNLFSPIHMTRMRVKVRVQENESVPTTTQLWNASNWAEREVFDMFGIRFEGHPDLRRILMDIRWEGHPLRKDYPLKKYQLFNEPEVIPEHLLKD